MLKIPQSLMGIVVAISLVGLAIHNTAEFGIRFNLQLGSGFLPMAVLMISILLFKQHVRQSQISAGRMLLGLGIINLLGAILTVLPLSFLPFVPEQTVGHYVAHIIYGLCQLPLMIVAFRLSSTT